MKKTNKSVEGVFQQTLEEIRVSPSPRVLRNLKRKLFITDFFSFNFRKFNVAYVSVIFVAVIFAPSLLNKKNKNAVAVESNGNESNNNISERNILPEESDFTSSVKLLNDEQKINESNEELMQTETSNEFELKAFYVADITSGCVPLSIHFQNKSVNAKTYNWDFGTGDKSYSANPIYIFNTSGVFKVKLTTTNSGGAKAEYIQTIQVHNKPESDFEINMLKSDLNTMEIAFSNKSTSAVSYKWSFGDNSMSDEKDPEHIYSNFGAYNVSLLSISKKGCTDTLTKINKFILKDYRLVFPLQFKPSLAGSNKGIYERPENQSFVFYPQNNGVKEYQIAISASNGTEVFSTKDIKQGWDGYIRGRVAPAGIYSYKAQGVYPNGKEFSYTGKVRLVIDKAYQNYNNN